MADLLEQLDLLRATERRVAMATLIGARGGSPRPVGAKLFVGAGGRLLGSVSIGGCVDAQVVEHGDRLLREGGRAERVTVMVDDVEALELGLACGAEFDLLVEPVSLMGGDAVTAAYESALATTRDGREAFVATSLTSAGVTSRAVLARASEAPRDALLVERFAPADILLIVGATDVAAALARYARGLGFHVIVVDGRERYATRDRFAAAHDLHVGMPAELARPYYREGASLVLASHDYKYELPVLRDALRSPLRFVGMLAGRKRAAAVRSLLRDDGLSDEQLARLQSPIGLDIGGREPEEIALSIAAQLVAAREGKPLATRREG